MRFIYTKTFVAGFSLFMALALFLILDATGYISILKDNSLKAFGSVTRVAAGGGNAVKTFFMTLATIRDLARDNSRLTQAIDELSFDNARLLSARQENAALRKALNFQERPDLRTVAVEVLTQDITGFSRTITVNKGKNAGLSDKQPVIAAPGIVVGRISKVYDSTAEVTLITDPSSVINAEVADTAARGLLRGEHGLSLMFDLVTQNELITPGDKLITSGLSGDFPRGLYIGEIVGISSSASELFQKAFVSPAADLRSLRFLFVIQ